jgi:carbonic anhydrase
LHFHAPSEHTVEGKHFDLELHIVHVDAVQNPAAVIAIFFDRVEGGTFYNEFLA